MNLGNENEYIEFKESLTQLDKGLKSLTAMLNKNGRSSIYFGVNDKGDVIGIDIGCRTLEDIRNKINNFIDPKIIFDVKTLTSDDNKT